MQAVINATQKETAIDQQQHSCETLICQCHQTILRLLSSAATASTGWRVCELKQWGICKYHVFLMSLLNIESVFFFLIFFRVCVCTCVHMCVFIHMSDLYVCLSLSFTDTHTHTHTKLCAVPCFSS